jgi:hypothetical protein
MNSRLTVRIFTFFILTICLIGNVNADSFSCKGTVERFGSHSVNSIYLKLSSMNTMVKICDLGSDTGASYKVTPEQCKIIYSTLLTAYAMNEVININFDNVGEATNCSSFSDWQLATARNVFLNKTLN